MISRHERSKTEAYGLFDWHQFDDDEKYLDEVIFLFEERKPVEFTGGDGKEKGTVMRMSKLEQVWEAKHFEQLRASLARLVSPTIEPDTMARFEIHLDLPAEFTKFANRVESPAILKYPHYWVTGTVGSDGAYEVTYRTLSEGKE